MPGRIMIVDDAAFMRMMLKDILTKNSCSGSRKLVTVMRRC